MLTRSVHDTAAILDVIGGAVPGALWTSTASPANGWTAQVGTDPGRLRIGVLTELLPETDTDTRTGLQEAAGLLRMLGHTLERAQPDGLFEEVPERLGRAPLALLAQLLYRAEEDLGRSLTREEIEPDVWAMALAGREVPATDVLELAALDQAWAIRLAKWWEEFELLLLPTCPVVAQPLRLWRQSLADPGAHRPHWNDAGRYTRMFNRSGQPAISVPLHWTREGLPVGIQLVAAYGGDALLLQVASQLERAHAWHTHRPGL
jgi:amidase